MTVSQEHVSRETIILLLLCAHSFSMLDCLMQFLLCALYALDPFLVSCVEEVSIHVAQFLNSQGVGKEVCS